MVSTVRFPILPIVQASDSWFSVLRISGAIVIRPRNNNVTPPNADPDKGAPGYQITFGRSGNDLVT